MELTYNEKLAIVRKDAKRAGFVFKRANCTVNGVAAYKLQHIYSYEDESGLYTLNSAFNLVYFCEGF